MASLAERRMDDAEETPVDPAARVVYADIDPMVAAQSAPLLAGAPNVVLIIGDDQAWTDFGLQTLGFVPRSIGNELARWRSFLASRYETIDELNEGY